MTNTRITTGENDDDQNRTNISKKDETKTRTRAAPPAEHYAIQSKKKQEQGPKTKRSRERTEDAHLCITILGFGPAFGRPDGRAGLPARRRDLAQVPESIFTRLSGC